MPRTPASIALEVNRSQKRVREVARELYGRLSEGVSRWEFDDAQSAELVARFGPVQGPREWVLQVGDAVRRRELHYAYGGQRQGGISTPRGIRDILIFTDPVAGARYGYDKFEGLREDGSYSYTGEGQYGDQPFVRGNLAIRDSARNGRTIRMFTTRGVTATYVGAFTTGDPTYRIEEIPDLDGRPREGIIFNLVPLDARSELLPSYGGVAPAEVSVLDWTPPEASDVVISQDEPQHYGERVVSRVEFQLQADFGRWLTRAGTLPSRLRLPVESGVIEPDLYVESRGWVVEAKKSTARAYVRQAIGQVLDYVHSARALGLEASPVILLPSRPSADLTSLIASVGIKLAYRDAESFEVREPM
ncbi:hypothetical protein [Agrococcus sp. SGAir0287]|uniref:hypothetical protein n=1 Tax=Agrococcus sp. SGAir0287 TaxID=2070347 RepID=UPI0010CD13FC|nr:hypothetical protein [Agrococcus sp. SGAir0287]QCR18579.1 hypothetical protein C1N71_03205 [Agrococcus sp. SGAir0287]